MAAVTTNNAAGTLSAGINSAATSIVLTAGQGALFPSLSGGRIFYATLVDSSNNIEVVKVTARSTDTLTVVRGQDGTSARAFSSGDLCDLRPTAALFEEKVSNGGTTLTSTRVPYANSIGDLVDSANMIFDGSKLTVVTAAASSSSNPSQGIVNGIVEGRLTLTTALPVTTSDVTAAETLYFTPYKGNRIAVFDGTYWQLRAFTELSLDVPDVTGVHDVFIYDNAGTLTLEALVWTNDTTRATALALQDGVLCKTGALTRRYLGTFYSTTAGNGQIQDARAARYLWNYYNRVDRALVATTESTDTWPYTTSAWRQANGSTANQLNFVIGVSEDTVTAHVTALSANTTVAAARYTGIGVDSTTAYSGLTGYVQQAVANHLSETHALWTGFPGIGKHYLAWLETGDGNGATTWSGDGGGPANIQAGMLGMMRA